MKMVLFVCWDNAHCSQIAAAFFNQMANTACAHAVSAGMDAANRVEPQVVEVMREAGIDLSRVTPQRLRPELVAAADLLVTIGCSQELTIAPGVRRDDWPLPDPKGQPSDRAREMRDELRRRVWKLIATEGWWKVRLAPKPAR